MLENLIPWGHGSIIKAGTYYSAKVNPEIHCWRQFATTLHKFHWIFLDFFTAMAKAKKLSLQTYSTGFGASFTDKKII